MNRRTFLALSSSALALSSCNTPAFTQSPPQPDAAWFAQSRRFLQLPMCRVAYVERGHGPVALFLHGFPLNGFQWRGALARLSAHRRCLAPDFMSLGSTETPEGQPITPATQVEMLAALLDALHIHEVDLVANDSGGMIAQLFIARYPHRVRSVLLTNCDVDTNNPPPLFVPAVALAKKNLFTERFVVPQLKDKNLARSKRGIGASFTYPEMLTDDTIETYFAPLVSPGRKAQLDQYTVALGENELVPIRENLRQWKGAARILWAMKDPFFPGEWADWLAHTLPGSRGVRRLAEANLFFPEEMPDVIAEEARKLWG